MYVRILPDEILKGFDDEVSIDLSDVYSDYDGDGMYNLREFSRDQLLEETEEWKKSDNQFNSR